MKAYLIPNAPAGDRWNRTQADGRAMSKHLGGLEWRPVEVPTDHQGLIDFLNEHDRMVVIAPGGAVIDDSRISGTPEGARQWELGAPTRDPPRYDPKHSADYGHAEFVPITHAAAIAASYNGCPACHRTWAAQVLAGISSAELDDLKMIADAIKAHVGELNQQLDEAGEARQ